MLSSRKCANNINGLGFDALGAMQHALQIQKDGRLGHQVLADIGVIPSAEERYAIGVEDSMKIDRASLTPFEAAITEGEEGQMFRVAYGAACAMEESAEGFDITLPTPEEIRFLRKVGKVADEITGGRFHEICMIGGPEEKRIRQLAAQKVKRQETRRLLPPGRVRTALPQRS